MIKEFFVTQYSRFNKEENNILKASTLMIFVSFLTKIIGMLTKTIAVAQLGAEKYGLFVAANTLPEFISNLLIFGSITSIIIPIFVEVIEKKGKKEFSLLFSSVVNVTTILLSLFSFITAILGNIVVPFFIKNFTRPVEPFTDDEIRQIISMMQILMLPQIFLGISSLASSSLNAFKRFFIPQIASLFYNIGVLLGTIFFIPLAIGKPWGLALAVLLGSVLHLIIQLPLLAHLKIKLHPIIDFKNTYFKNIFVVGLPRFIALGADQIATVIDRLIGLSLGAASLGAYYLGVTLVTIPFSLFSNTFSIAAMPQLSESFARSNMKAFKSIFSQTFNQIAFFSIPVTAILLVLRVPLVRLFYGLFGKEFSWENTLMVSWTVLFFSFGLVPEILNIFLNRTFYAIKDTIRPLIVGIFVVFGGIVTGILFTNYFSHFNSFSIKQIHFNASYFFDRSSGLEAVGGLALSSGIIYTLSFIFLLIFLSKKIGGLDKSDFWVPFVKKTLAGIFMVIFLYALAKIWENLLNTSQTINLVILTISTIIPGLFVYIWILSILSDKEASFVEKMIFKFIKFFLINL